MLSTSSRLASVGVLAVDLEDRIESWNAQMEVMYAMSRAQVLGERLSDVFPDAFTEEFYRFRQNCQATLRVPFGPSLAP